MTIIINLFGAPGCGKSTTAAGLFYYMKLAGKEVELVTEFAKDLTWAERTDELNNQLFVSGNQWNRLTRLLGKVDYIVTDAPILAGIVFSPGQKNLHKLLFDYHNSTSSVNILLQRGNFAYNPNGRLTENHTSELHKAYCNLGIKYDFHVKTDELDIYKLVQALDTRTSKLQTLFIINP